MPKNIENYIIWKVWRLGEIQMKTLLVRISHLRFTFLNAQTSLNPTENTVLRGNPIGFNVITNYVFTYNITLLILCG